MNNEHITAQIINMKVILRTFEESCKMAAIKNDGCIDKEEEKILKKISAATSKFTNELDKLIR